MLLLLPFTAAMAAPACPGSAALRFHCTTRGDKALSVCEQGDRLTYRFGQPSAPELTLSGTVEVSHDRSEMDTDRHVLGFWNDGHRYAVVVEQTKGRLEAGVVVRKGPDKVASVACTGAITADLSTLDGRYPGADEQPSSWVGMWDRGEDGILTIEEQSGRLVLKDGSALFSMGPDRVHTGEVRGPIQRTGATATVTLDDCTLTMTRIGPDHLRAEDNGHCGGLNVRFDGEYHRQP